MKLLFFGLPQAALALLEDGHCVVHAAICRKDAEGVDELRAQLGAERVSVLPKVTPAWIDLVAPEGVDLIASWFWTKKLAPEVVACARLGSVGVHPSLLPRHRGPDPVFHAIDTGDALTGVTAHVLAGEYDVGDVYARRELSIDPAWDGWSLALALDIPSLALLREVCMQFLVGPLPRALPQDDALATEAPTLAESELELDPTWTSARALLRIRAAAPWPGAWVWAGDELLTLGRAEDAGRSFRGVAPGTVMVWSERVYLATFDGALEVLAARVGEDADPREGRALVDAVAALSGPDA